MTLHLYKATGSFRTWKPKAQLGLERLCNYRQVRGSARAAILRGLHVPRGGDCLK